MSQLPAIAQPHARVLESYLKMVSGDVDAVQTAAHGWSTAATGTQAASAGQQRAVTGARAGWTGSGGDALGASNDRLRGGTDAQTSAMSRVGTVLQQTAGEMRAAQQRMQTVVTQFVSSMQTAKAVAATAPAGSGQQYLVTQTGKAGNSAIAAAGRVKADLDTKLAASAAELQKAKGSKGIPSSEGKARHTYGLTDLRRWTTFSKDVSAVDDSGGHRAIVKAQFTKENDGRYLRIRGFSEAIKYEQNGKKPIKIYSQDFITMNGEKRNAINFGVNGSVGLDALGVGVTGGTGWQNYNNGDILKMNVTDTHRNHVDISGKIEIPRNSTELDYKKEVVFVYADGSRIQRTVAFKVPL